MKPELTIIAHDIRSIHNVGSLLRTSDGLGVSHIYFTGYTPYPQQEKDSRLPHLAEKINQQIHKTALGAEKTVPWTHNEDIHAVIVTLKSEGFSIVGLEQAPNSVPLPEFVAPSRLAILIGSEVTGIEKELLKKLDYCLEIPMVGKKESFNVVEATTMAIYHCQLISPLL